MSIFSLSGSVSIDSFTAHDEHHLKLQINKPPLLEYILQKYPCNVFQADIFLYFRGKMLKYYLITEINHKVYYNTKLCTKLCSLDIIDNLVTSVSSC